MLTSDPSRSHAKGAHGYIGDVNVRASTLETRLAAPGRIALRCGAALLVVQTGGCARGAPSLVFFGAYFPLWLACIVIGAAAAGIARALMVVSGLSERLPYQLLLCTAIGTSTGLLVAMLCFGV